MANPQEMMQAAMHHYKSSDERAALRCALGDAAALCDQIATRVGFENRGRRGKISNEGLRLAAIATRCANEIWWMRELVTNAPAKPETEQVA